MSLLLIFRLSSENIGTSSTSRSKWRSCRRKRLCDLVHTDFSRQQDDMLDSIQRRNHIFFYMVEWRIGGDILKRALSEIIIESNKAVIVHENSSQQSILRKIPLDDFDDKLLSTKFLPSGRQLRKLHGDFFADISPPATNVSSGFDEVPQGVAVGPFFNRDTCGTDVCTMVRLWYFSPGIPLMQGGY